MTNNEFKEALEFMAVSTADPMPYYNDTIRRALLIADRLMREPSDGMKAAWQAQDDAEREAYFASGCLMDCSKPWNRYKAMVNKMLEEIEGGK